MTVAAGSFLLLASGPAGGQLRVGSLVGSTWFQTRDDGPRFSYDPSLLIGGAKTLHRFGDEASMRLTFDLLANIHATYYGDDFSDRSYSQPAVAGGVDVVLSPAMLRRGRFGLSAVGGVGMRKGLPYGTSYACAGFGRCRRELPDPTGTLGRGGAIATFTASGLSLSAESDVEFHRVAGQTVTDLTILFNLAHRDNPARTQPPLRARRMRARVAGGVAGTLLGLFTGASIASSSRNMRLSGKPLIVIGGTLLGAATGAFVGDRVALSRYGP